MAQEGRTRFAWTWAGVLAGVVLAGASYGSRQVRPSRAQQAEEVSPSHGDGARVELAQATPGTTQPGLTPAPGTTPGAVPGATPGVGVTPGVTPPAPTFNLETDGGVGGSGSVTTTTPTVTMPPPTTGTGPLSTTPGNIDTGNVTTGTGTTGAVPGTTPGGVDTGVGGSGLPFPSVTGGDGGM